MTSQIRLNDMPDEERDALLQSLTDEQKWELLHRLTSEARFIDAPLLIYRSIAANNLGEFAEAKELLEYIPPEDRDNLWAYHLGVTNIQLAHEASGRTRARLFADAHSLLTRAQADSNVGEHARELTHTVEELQSTIADGGRTGKRWFRGFRGRSGPEGVGRFPCPCRLRAGSRTP